MCSPFVPEEGGFYADLAEVFDLSLGSKQLELQGLTPSQFLDVPGTSNYSWNAATKIIEFEITNVETFEETAYIGLTAANGTRYVIYLV